MRTEWSHVAFMLIRLGHHFHLNDLLLPPSQMADTERVNQLGFAVLLVKQQNF